VEAGNSRCGGGEQRFQTQTGRGWLSTVKTTRVQSFARGLGAESAARLCQRSILWGKAEGEGKEISG
jgi:hypothetical protein